MNKFKANPEINKDFILSYLSQEEIMSKYLEKDATRISGLFCSPLRKDKHPTCSIAWLEGKLLFRDWSESYPKDCFGVVKEKYNCDFYTALKIIAKDFDLVHNVSIGKRDKRKLSKQETNPKTKQKSIIEVRVDKFSQKNIEYLKQYHITSDQCKRFNIYHPSHVWVNDYLYYVYDDNNPALAYYFGKDEKDNPKWKIYFYESEHNRFVMNTNRINGWIQLPKDGNILVITKSLKDVVVLDHFDIPSIAMQAESQTPYDYIIDELNSRFDQLISLFDYDNAGITRSEILFEKYEIPYFYIKDDKAKDISDYIKEYGYDETKNFLYTALCLK